MSKAVSPAVGFNDNVRRRNRNFHIQTEDSGVARPHIITHLFTDGGRIVKSVRHSYADIVGEEHLGQRVRERMKAQHVGMLESLKSGEYDALVWGSRAPGAKPKVAAPAAAELPTPADAPAIAGATPATATPEPLPAPPLRRSTPPIVQRKLPPPPPRKTMPRIETSPSAALSPAAARARKSSPPTARRSSRPPPPRLASRSTVSVANPRDGLVSQTLDEVILRMLSEEQDTNAGS